MADYTRLISALRICSSDGKCESCSLHNMAKCQDIAFIDAANAIEQLVSEREQLRAERDYLRAQMPKRGKWLSHPDKTVTDHKICSVCGVGTRFRVYCYDEMQKWIEEDSYLYCPRCGAKMEAGE